MELIDLAYKLRSVELPSNLIFVEFSLNYVESSLLPICSIVLAVDDFDYSVWWPGLDHYYLWAIMIWIQEKLEHVIDEIEFSLEIVDCDFYTPLWPTNSKWINLH